MNGYFYYTMIIWIVYNLQSIMTYKLFDECGEEGKGCENDSGKGRKSNIYSRNSKYIIFKNRTRIEEKKTVAFI